MATALRASISSKILGGFTANSDPKNLFAKLQCALELQIKDARPELYLNVNELLSGVDVTDSLFLKRQISNLDSLDKTAVRNGFTFPIDDKDAYLEEAFRSRQKSSPLASIEPETILVEFSSPNIAKPFHMGHLRSTIIGNCISNLLQRVNHKVHRINYLGDWGTQFGYLALGMEMAGVTEEQMQRNPIQHLFEAYVLANRSAESDPSLAAKARNIFCDLENGAVVNLDSWNSYRDYTVTELRQMYDRLGVQFDEYCWESDYRRTNIQRTVLDEMLRRGVMIREDDDRRTVRVGNRIVPVMKSDGTTLYLARDIAALEQRANVRRFDRMLYVVDNSQFDHFNALFEVGRQMDIPGVAGAQHVKFGRIRGMSTRKGNVVFLTDILNEARDIMHQKQCVAKTTKIDVASDETADTLGISAVIVNDLKQRRHRDYEFDWTKALQMNGDTGIKLQYTHCRLCSLAETIEHIVERQESQEINLLVEPDAEHLIFEIARFDEILFRAQHTLEPCVLVNYLFALSNSISRALKRLNVKDHPKADVQQQRAMLFRRAHVVLGDGMRILGLKPLTKM